MLCGTHNVGIANCELQPVMSHSTVLNELKENESRELSIKRVALALGDCVAVATCSVRWMQMLSNLAAVSPQAA